MDFLIKFGREMMEPAPCVDCICMPICQNKRYEDFLAECDLIWDHRLRNFRNLGFVEYYQYLTDTHKIFEVRTGKGI